MKYDYITPETSVIVVRMESGLLNKYSPNGTGSDLGDPIYADI